MIKINNVEFANETFSNKEVIYKKVGLNKSENEIKMVFESNKDIADLMFVVEYVRSVYPNATINLFMPYIPYSRMDREINDQIFSLKMFANIINSMKFDNVTVYDPHSKVSNELINNLNVHSVEYAIQAMAYAYNIDVIMFPDKGARSKYTSMYKNLCSKYPVIYAEKVRDLNNKGKLLESKLINENNIDLTGKKVLIVDDICVYGNTFKFASMALREAGASEVYLWVTHCENAVNDGPLLQEGHIDWIVTTDSIIRNVKTDKISTVDVKV